MSQLVRTKQELDQWLDQVDYGYLNSQDYVPSDFSLTFMNFIKLVNGEEGESHRTPPVHLKMLDKIAAGTENIANLCHRGLGKTTVFYEYFVLYLAVIGHLPNFGPVEAMIYVSDTMENGVKTGRKQIEFRYNKSEFLQHWIPKATFTDAYMEFTNREGKLLGVKQYGAQTGIRGTKIFGKRPVLAILDDLVGDKAAASKATMDAIKDTVYNGVNHALDPTRRKIIFNGTPFNKEDILVEAVESGAWDVNVWPVCEKFPCTEEEFQGSWPERFSYDFVKKQYDMAEDTGKIASFNQELMLRITSEEERIIQDEDILWYDRDQLLNKKDNFNFYITTDFATSEKDTADFSVIKVWAYNSNADWFWVDGVVKRQEMDKNIDDLFRLVSEYKPMEVGIEITGQQGAFINWLQGEMMNRNIWFTFASSGKTRTPGIRPATSKLQRLNLVAPWFKAKKIYFPNQLRRSAAIVETMQQLRLATHSGLKGKDDCIDAISMLGYLKPWKPSETGYNPVQSESNIWKEAYVLDSPDTLSSYIV